MEIKKAMNDVQSMAQDGDAILRSLQNKSLPVIDLLVRESLQNSLDATLESAKNTKVDFFLGEFDSFQLSQHFDELTDTLQSRFGYQNETFLAIKDSNTSGLTGDYRATDANTANKSNFFKLVFGIGKNQEADGAGGSWGLGKTSYFRLGIGIVIYYTRVKLDDGRYEERLIASMIESPKQANRLLPDNGRGIAWWGTYSNEISDQLLPLTDEKSIVEILNIFKLERYKNDETGTTIIVPYLGRNELFTEAANEDKLPWEHDRESALRMAIQRWYAPRLMNLQYPEINGNSTLICKVNNKGFNEMIYPEPTFDIFKKLYTSAALGQSDDDSIIVKPIYLKRNALKDPSKNPIGYIAFKEVTKKELLMDPPENKATALEYIGIKDKDAIEKNSSKIIAYTRKPGMIIEYSVDGEWSPNASFLKDDVNLFGFFVPNSKGELVDKYNESGYYNLEQYLRATENADHANWVDEDGITIVRRIKQATSKEIEKYYLGEVEEKQSRATSGLSRKLGQLLLPPKNFGKTSARKSESSKLKREVRKRNRISDIRVLKTTPINENLVEIMFDASIQKESQNSIFIQILTQEKKLIYKDWIKTFKSESFPFDIEDLIVETIDEINYKKSFKEIEDSNIEFQQNENKSEIHIISKVSEPIIIEGKLLLKVKSLNFIPNIAISSQVKKGEE